MNRREMLKTLAVLGSGALLKTAGAGELLAQTLSGKPTGAPADLVAVMGGEPADMLTQALSELGGLDRYVKKGQRVAVKPNIGWAEKPERGATTNPDLVAALIRNCLAAGAAEVVIFDHTCEEWSGCYHTSGIAKAVEEAGGKMAPAHEESYYQSAALPLGKTLKDIKVHQAILDCDVWFNVPVLKHHGGAGMTAAIKGLMGAVWNRRYYHGNNLHQCLADFLAVRKPDLNVVDCYRVMTSHGPRGGSPEDVSLVKMQLLSTDIVAVDAAAARLMGREPGDCRYVTLAHEAGHGEIDAARLATRRITV